MSVSLYTYTAPEDGPLVDYSKPLVVSFFAGPGTGKSTTAALVFGSLKQRGYNVELVHEYAKDLTWEKAHVRLSHQPLIAAEQMFRMDRLDKQVDAIITDTSPLLGLIYAKNSTPAFEAWLRDDFRRRPTLSFFLVRKPERPYNPYGRRQSAESAQDMDTKIRTMLHDNRVSHYTVWMDTRTNHIDEIVEKVENRLRDYTND